MKFNSKEELLESIETEHDRFLALAATVPRQRYSEPEVWGDGWTLKDLFAHLTEWEQMFLEWYRLGLGGEEFPRPAAGYKWNQTPALNREIWRRYRGWSWKKVHERFETSYEEIVELVRGLSSEALLTPGHFEWTGEYPLTTYLAPNTCSHYRTATKILKRWPRRQGAA